MGTPAKLRVLVAGVGPFGREHLDRLRRRYDVVVAGIADLSAENRALASRGESGLLAVADPIQLIDTAPADALVVATSTRSHVPIARHALERGLCVLLEKPVAGSAAEARTLVQAQSQSSGFALPAHILRHSKDHMRLAAAVREGAIGRVLYVNSRRYRDEAHATHYTETDPVLMTLVHDIDLARWLVAAPFRSVLARRLPRDGFRSLTALSAATDDGVICDLRTAWTFPQGTIPADRLEVVGDQGSIELVLGQSLTLVSGGREAALPLTPGDDALVNEHEAFLACVRDRGRPLAVSLSDATEGLALAEAALTSLASSSLVELHP